MKKGANTSRTIDLQKNDMKRSTFSKVFHNFVFLIISLHHHNFLS